MVCIYCGNKTEVTNSRPQAKNMGVWRRRACKTCDAQFTSVELPDYSTAFVVQGLEKKTLTPFSRDKLYLSLYKALGHRTDPGKDATALTATTIGRLLSKKRAVSAGTIDVVDLAKASYEVLKRFDPLAGASYKTYHQTALKK